MNNDPAIVRRFYTCLLSGDVAGVGALLTADVVLHVPGRHELAGDYHGPEEVAGFASASRSTTARFTWRGSNPAASLKSGSTTSTSMRSTRSGERGSSTEELP